MDCRSLTMSLIRRGGWWLVALTLCALIAAGADLLLPVVLGHGVDAVLSHQPTSRALLGSAVLIAVLVVAGPLADLASGAAVADATAWLRHRLVRHLLALGPRVGIAVGDQVTRVVGNAADAGATGVSLILGILGVVPVAGSVVALTLLDPWLVTVFLAGTVGLAAVLRAFARDNTDVAVRYQRIQAQVATRLTEALGGARTIAAAGTVETEVRRCLAPLPELSACGMDSWRLVARTSARTNVGAPLLQLSVVAIGGWEVTRGRLTPGELLAAVQYAALAAGLGGIVSAVGGYTRSLAGVRRTREVLSWAAPGYGRRDLPAGSGRLEFHRVRVDSASGPGLADVSLVVPGGATVAVVGRSGSGKSLLAGLAGRLRDPDAGRVLLDGVPLAELSADALRREIGVAFERPALVGATVAEAVGLGAPDLDGHGLRTVLRAAQVDTFVDRLPAGAATPLARAPMSGGEAQRLGLARAWPARRLLVLDDATSSLDTATEAQITGLLTGGHRTHVVVAHRVATAARCDRVVWLEAGRVRAIGRHAALWRDPDYRGVFGTTAGQPS